MSDLEDDILMAFLKQGRQMERMKERDALVEEVWKSLDLFLRAVLRNPELMRRHEAEMRHLKETVVAVLEFDEEHSEGA